MQMAKKYAKIPLPPLPATEDELLNRNNLLGLVWTRASVFKFWLISLTAVRPQKLRPENSD